MVEAQQNWPIDADRVNTAAELAAAMQAVRAACGLTHQDVEKAARGRASHRGYAPTVSKSASSALCVRGEGGVQTLRTFLAVCGVPEIEMAAWIRAWERVRGTGGERPPGAIRVKDANPRLLGVHRAISLAGAPGDLPAYVERDIDTDPGGVRAAIQAAAETGGFVLLVGGSSVGKTRCAFEGVRELLPDWWLLYPGSAAEVKELARQLPPEARLVVWLDELQRYLGGPQGLTAATACALLQAPGPRVLISTLWPEYYTAYVELRPHGSGDVSVEERLVVELADVVTVPAAFTSAERERGRRLAGADSRIRLALDSTDYGVTQVLAAVPQLVDRWEHADPYAKAVLNAAVDAIQLGVSTPLPAALLREAAPGYCDAGTRAAAPKDWWERSLAYATAPLHGAVSALAPTAAPGSDMGEASGYVVADYLRQHTIWRCVYSRPPASVWEACLHHITDPEDNLHLCHAAHRRLLYCYVEPFYRRSSGGWNAAEPVTEVLIKQGRLDEALDILRAHADGTHKTGPGRWAADRLYHLLSALERIDELRECADAGDREAAGWLAGVLARLGRIEELQALVGPDHGWIIVPSDDSSVERGRPGKLTAYSGHQTLSMNDVLAKYGRVTELRARASAGDNYAAEDLARLLARQGEIEEAIVLFRTLSGAGYLGAGGHLARLLAKQGLIDELRARADARDESAMEHLAQLLIKLGRIDELRTRAGVGDRYAIEQLAHMLAGQGRAAEALSLLNTSSGPGTWHSEQLLIKLLAEHGRLEELRNHAETGRWWAAEPLANLLAEQGRLEEAVVLLRPYYDGAYGSTLVNAAELHTELLAKYGHEEELRVRADADDWGAREQLAQLLARHERIDELRARAGNDDEPALEQLTLLLIKQGRVEEAIELQLASYREIARVTAMLGDQGLTDEADRLQRFGLTPEGRIASDP